METNNENVKVFCRIRPPVEHEKCKSGSSSIFSISSPFSSRKCISVPKTHGASKTINVHLKSTPQTPKSFTFDRVFDEESSQNDVFQIVGVPLTRACLAGYNGTIFAYGQTGSGKTFTMQGPENSLWMESHSGSVVKSSTLRGVVPRVFEYLFDEKSLLDSTKSEQPNDTVEMDSFTERIEHKFTCSFLEIYNERVFDLLDPRGNSGASNDFGGLQLRENGRRGVFVEGLIESVVENAQQATALMKLGAQNRHVGQTLMNRESSRSHSVFILQIQTKQIKRDGITRMRTSRFNLVDLAGSERQRSTEASGDRLKEAGSINKSLSALGNVIMGLVDKSAGKNRHVHYRDSKLTFLLKDSLGGNSKTFMVATVSPSSESAHETLSTLKFAQRAKSIRNEAVINEATTGNVTVLQQEIQRLKLQLQSHQGRGNEMCREVEKSEMHAPSMQSSLALKAPDDHSAIEASSNTRLCELECTLAQLSDQYIDLQKAHERLKEGKARTENLMTSMEQKISHQRFLLRLLQHSGNDKEKSPQGSNVRDSIDAELNYTPTVDAVQWRNKYEELEEAYVQLLEQSDDQHIVDGTLGGSYNHRELIDEFEKLSKMYVSLSCQLSRIISDKQELQNVLRGMRKTEETVECTHESCKQSLEKKLADQASDFGCRLAQAKKLQEIVEQKAAATSMDLLQSKQKEMALTAQLFEVQRVCQEAQFCLNEETRSRETLTHLLLTEKMEKNVLEGKIQRLCGLELEWEIRFAKQRVLNQLMDKANERRSNEMAVREQVAQQEVQHLQNTLHSMSMELQLSATSLESLTESNCQILSDFEISQKRNTALMEENAKLTQHIDQNKSLMSQMDSEHELITAHQRKRIKHFEGLIERKNKHISAVNKQLDRAFGVRSSLRARLHEVELMSKEENTALHIKHRILMKQLLFAEDLLQSKDRDLLDARNESDARLRESEALKYEIEDGRSRMASVLLTREEELARHQHAYDLLLERSKKSQEAQKQAELSNAKLINEMNRIRNQLSVIRTTFAAEKSEIDHKLCDMKLLFEHSTGFMTQTTANLECERCNLDNIGFKMSSFEMYVGRIEERYRALAGRISQMQATLCATQNQSASLNVSYVKAQERIEEMEILISNLSDEKNHLADKLHAQKAHEDLILNEKNRALFNMESELKDSQLRTEQMNRRLIEVESSLTQSTLRADQLDSDNAILKDTSSRMTEQYKALCLTQLDMKKRLVIMEEEQRRIEEAHHLAHEDIDGHKYRYLQLRLEHINLENVAICREKKLHEMEISYLAEVKQLREGIESLERSLAKYRTNYENLICEKKREIDQVSLQVEDMESKLYDSLQKQRTKETEYKDRRERLERELSATLKTCDEQKNHISLLLVKCATVDESSRALRRLGMELNNCEMKVEECNQKRCEVEFARTCALGLLHAEENRAKLATEDMVAHRLEITALNDKVNGLNASFKSTLDNNGTLQKTIETLGNRNEYLEQTIIKLKQEQSTHREISAYRNIESLQLTVEDLLSRLMCAPSNDMKIFRNQLPKTNKSEVNVPKQRRGQRLELKHEKRQSKSDTIPSDASSKGKAMSSLRMENAALLKEKNRWKQEAQALTNKLKDLAKETDQLVSHHNKRQKIQHHIKVKEENNRLQDVIRTLTEDKYKLQCNLQKLQSTFDKQMCSNTSERGKENTLFDQNTSRKASSDNSTVSSCDSGLEDRASVRLTKKTKRV